MLSRLWARARGVKRGKGRGNDQPVEFAMEWDGDCGLRHKEMCQHFLGRVRVPEENGPVCGQNVAARITIRKSCLLVGLEAALPSASVARSHGLQGAAGGAFSS